MRCADLPFRVADHKELLRRQLERDVCRLRQRLALTDASSIDVERDRLFRILNAVGGSA